MQFHALLSPNYDGNCERADKLLFIGELDVADRRPSSAANATNVDHSSTAQAADCGISARGQCLPAVREPEKENGPGGPFSFF